MTGIFWVFVNYFKELGFPDGHYIIFVGTGPKMMKKNTRIGSNVIERYRMPDSKESVLKKDRCLK
jgi:hypothetical protein